MTTERFDAKTLKLILKAQQIKCEEYFICKHLADVIRGEKNKKILKHIAEEELEQQNLCHYYTGCTVKPGRFTIWLYYIIARLFGVTFGLKMIKRREKRVQAAYRELAKEIPEAEPFLRDEEKMNREMFKLIDDERLEYSSDIVRGLEVALIEISGSLAGFTLALQDHDLILLAGIIIGVTSILTITATEYLAVKSSTEIKHPLKSAFYAGLANLATVITLLLPYILFNNIYLSLFVMILAAVIVVYFISFYLSVSKDTSFKKLFFEMTGISLGIAALAFGIGLLAREVLNIHLH